MRENDAGESSSNAVIENDDYVSNKDVVIVKKEEVDV